MKLSVVTVCLNARDTIADAVESVHRQTYPNVEHIVVDGGSDDGTVEILQQYKHRIARLISERDEGLYFAMNKGIEAATGEYVGFLNSDDVYHSEYALQSVANAVADSRPDAVHSDLVYVDRHDPSRVIRYWHSKPYVKGMFEAGWHPAHPTLFVKTQLLRSVGGFDTRYRYHADFDLMVRLFVARKISSVYVPGVMVRMRAGGQSTRSLSNVYKGNRESWEIARRFGVARTPLWMVRKLGYRVGQFFHRPTAGAR
ncbi:MAG: glycosyltransferase [Betaproteobacteria bacterium]|nr:MAG: glycosyltransferase [Betaproteobacteria bacterium]